MGRRRGLFAYRRQLKELDSEEERLLEGGKFADKAKATELSEHLAAISDLRAAYRLKGWLVRMERRLVTALAGTSIAIVVALMVCHPPSTEVEADLRLTDVSFVASSGFTLLRPTAVGRLTVSDVGSASVLGNTYFQMVAKGTEALTAETKPLKGATASLSLPRLQVHPKSMIEISVEGPGIYNLSVTPPDGSNASEAVVFGARGNVLLSIGTVSRTISGSGVSSIQVVPVGRRIGIGFEIDPKSPIALQAVTPIEEISLAATDAESVLSDISALKSGSIVWNEFGDKKTSLRPYEPVTIVPLASGDHQRGLFLRELILDKDGIRAKLFGRVRSVTKGNRNDRSETMPSMLEFLDANNRLKLIWSALLVIAGFGASAIRWALRKNG